MIAEIKRKALENYVPIVRDETIKKIIEVLKENNIKNILEIGTAVGYSGIVMLQNSQAYLTSIEKNRERYFEAKENFEKCGLLNRVELIEGDASLELEKLVTKEKQFDFIFLDGPKGQYIKYYPYLKKLLSKGGILFADNILMNGLTEDDSRVNHKNRTMVRNMKNFVETLKNDKDFITKFYEIDDGFSISKLI